MVEERPRLSEQELEERISFLSEEIELLKSEGRTSEYIHNLYELALLQGDYDKIGKSIDNLKFCIDFFERTSDNVGASSVRGSLGVIYFLNKDYLNSLENYQKAFNFYDKLPLKKRERIVCLKGIGLNQMNLNLLEEAIETFLKCAEISSEENQIEDFLDCISNLIQIYESQNQWDVMIELYFKALEAFKQLQDKKGIINTHFNIGILYKNLKNYEESLIHFKKGTNIANDDHIAESIIKGTSLIGETYVHQKQLRKAATEFIKCLSVAKKVKAKNAIEQSKILLNTLGLDNNQIKEMLNEYESELNQKD